jgi:hypothetical protein
MWEAICRAFLHWRFSKPVHAAVICSTIQARADGKANPVLEVFAGWAGFRKHQ